MNLPFQLLAETAVSPKFQALRDIAATNQWGFLGAEIALVVLALAILMADVFFGKTPAAARAVALAAIVGQVAILGFTLAAKSEAPSGPLFGGLLQVSAWGQLWRVLG